MSEIQTLNKTTGENILFDFDFSNHGAIAQRGGILASVTSVTFTPNDGVLIVGAPAFAGNRVQVRISVGVNKTIYLGSAKAVTDKGDTIECRGKLLVEDSV
jgi:hypothetical protein